MQDIIIKDTDNNEKESKALKVVSRFNFTLLFVFALCAVFIQELKVQNLKSENAELIQKVSREQEKNRKLDQELKKFKDK